jgi:hypothetical protein
MSKEIKCFGRCWTRRECLKAIGGVAVGTLALASGIVWLRGKKSVYELGQDKVVEYQKLCRPKIEELLGAENYDRCCIAMLREYDEFAPHLPILEDSNNRGVFFRNAPFILSLYRALLGEFALTYQLRNHRQFRPTTQIFRTFLWPIFEITSQNIVLSDSLGKILRLIVANSFIGKHNKARTPSDLTIMSFGKAILDLQRVSKI